MDVTPTENERCFTQILRALQWYLRVSFYWLTFPILSDQTDLLTFLSQVVSHGNTDATDAALNSNNKQGRATENGKCQKATALTTEKQACTHSLTVKGNTPS